MTYRTQAIVLRTMSWPRHARFFVFYTKEHGKIKGVAAGAEKIKSKVAGHLQPFVISEVMMAHGRSIDRVAQARLQKRFTSFSTHYHLYLLGSYVLEVVEKLTKEHVADEQIWAEMMAVLDELEEQGEWGDPQRFSLLVRIFAFRLLDRMGYRPELRRCVSCRSEEAARQPTFSVLQGGLICVSCRQRYRDAQNLSVDSLKMLRAILRLPVSQSARVILQPEDLAAVSTVIDQLVTVQLQSPLQTLQLLSVQPHTLGV